MAKRPTLKDYHVTLRLAADVVVRVAASTPEEALAKGRDVEVKYDDLLDVDDIVDGSAEVIGVWAID